MVDIDVNLFKFLKDLKTAGENLAKADANLGAAKDFRKQCTGEFKAAQEELLEYFARINAKTETLKAAQPAPKEEK